MTTVTSVSDTDAALEENDDVEVFILYKHLYKNNLYRACKIPPFVVKICINFYTPNNERKPSA